MNAADADGDLAPRYLGAPVPNSRRHHGPLVDLDGRRVRSHSALVKNLPFSRCLATHSVCA